MVRHEGHTCDVCGTPLRQGDEVASGVCDDCWNWQGIGTAEAIQFANAQQRQEDRARWKQRGARS